MFYCSKCDQHLPEINFFKKKTGTKQSWCKSCRKNYFFERYDQRSNFIRKLKEVPCTDCGVQYHYAVMQFDHIGEDKVFNISRGITTNISWKRILLEISKCEIVCANCHAIRTFNRRQGQVA